MSKCGGLAPHFTYIHINLKRRATLRSSSFFLYINDLIRVKKQYITSRAQGFLIRSLRVPNEGQTRDPRLNGTLHVVGFGETFALKVIYCFSHLHIESVT